MALPARYYVTDEEGKRVGVLLDLAAYEALQPEHAATELLPGLSSAELQALTDSQLTTTAHTCLASLLERHRAGTLSSKEEAELDRLVEQIDILTLLKTRARYTLQHRANATPL